MSFPTTPTGRARTEAIAALRARYKRVQIDVSLADAAEMIDDGWRANTCTRCGTGFPYLPPSQARYLGCHCGGVGCPLD